MHEQSETIQNADGRWVNVYGKATPQAGQPLPQRYDFEAPDYGTVRSAEHAARKRSQMEGRRLERGGYR